MNDKQSENNIRFGPAGNPEDFYEKGNKASEQMPAYLARMGLDAYEYQCSRGVRVSEEKARQLKAAAGEHGIRLSVHAPYYISLSSPDQEKQEKSIKYIIDTAMAAQKMGADRIVVHTGALLKLTRQQAMENVKETMKRALDELDALGLGAITVCPETMGKLNQLGDTSEVIELCRMDRRLLPAIDFGHLYCRRLGALATRTDWVRELTGYLEVLGYERMEYFHSHFSKMEYTLAGGEKRHVTFRDEGFGPDFEAVAEALIELKLKPRIICESAGTQSLDALAMKEVYFGLLGQV